MLSKFYSFLLIVIFSLFTLNSGYSQGTRLVNRKAFLKKEKLALTASLGLTTYYGDLCDAFECMQFRPNLGIGAIFRFTNHISNKTELSYYRLYSKDVHAVRNLDFRSGNVEFYTSGMLDVFPYTKHYRKRKFISPYVFAGIGITYFNPKGTDPRTGKWVALRPLQTEGTTYTPVTLILPYGGGVKIKFQRHIDFMFEIGYRKTFTDKLDDVGSNSYQNLSSFSDEQAAALSMKSTDPYYSSAYIDQQRGNKTRKDGYFIVNVKMRYVLGAKHTHFKGKHPLLKPHHK